jgi:short-subunit dehydrogenase
MIEKGRGGIIFMSSLAEGIWKELKGKGIDVIATCAGAISTPGYKNAQNSKDAPGTMNASVVAESTLKALGRGPVHIPGLTNKLARFFMGRLLPRKLAISIMDKSTKELS